MDVEIKIWEDTRFPNSDDNLVIHFEIPAWNEVEEYQVLGHVFWKKNKNDSYKPMRMFISRPCAIHYTFQNGIIIKGTLEIKKFRDFNSKDTFGVFADFYYYKNELRNYIWHTEGFLISFNPKIPNDVPINSIEEIDNTSVPLSSMVTSDVFSDLLPYMYLSDWLKITTDERLWNFVYYKPFATSTDVFLFSNKLASLKKENNREGMQVETICFIEGQSPYVNQYVTDVNRLQGFIGSFKMFYHFFKEEIPTTIVEKTCLFFATDEVSFSDYLISEDYLVSKERIWESYFALIIERGYAMKNLMDLTEVLTLCNFFENVFKNDIDPIALSNDALRSLFNSTIVLDINIFPLPPYVSSPQVTMTNGILPYVIDDLKLVK